MQSISSIASVSRLASAAGHGSFLAKARRLLPSFYIKPDNFDERGDYQAGNSDAFLEIARHTSDISNPEAKIPSINFGIRFDSEKPRASEFEDLVLKVSPSKGGTSKIYSLQLIGDARKINMIAVSIPDSDLSLGKSYRFELVRLDNQ